MSDHYTQRMCDCSDGPAVTNPLPCAPCPPNGKLRYQEFWEFGSGLNLTDCEIDTIARNCHISKETTSTATSTQTTTSTDTTLSSNVPETTSDITFSSRSTESVSSSKVPGTSSEVTTLPTSSSTRFVERDTSQTALAVGLTIALLVAVILVVLLVIVRRKYRFRHRCLKCRGSENSGPHLELDQTKEPPSGILVQTLYTAAYRLRHSCFKCRGSEKSGPPVELEQTEAPHVQDAYVNCTYETEIGSSDKQHEHGQTVPTLHDSKAANIHDEEANGPDDKHAYSNPSNEDSPGSPSSEAKDSSSKIDGANYSPREQSEHGLSLDDSDSGQTTHVIVESPASVEKDAGCDSIKKTSETPNRTEEDTHCTEQTTKQEITEITKDSKPDPENQTMNSSDQEIILTKNEAEIQPKNGENSKPRDAFSTDKTTTVKETDKECQLMTEEQRQTISVQPRKQQ